MSKINGTIICEQCKESIEWEYIIPQHISSPYLDVVKIDSEKSYARKIAPSEFRVRCPHCDNINIFLYNTK